MLFSRRGYSLTEMTIALGITGAIALGVTSMMSSMTQQVRSFEFLVQKQEIISTLNSLIADPAICNSMLANSTLTAGGTLSTVPLTAAFANVQTIRRSGVGPGTVSTFLDVQPAAPTRPGVDVQSIQARMYNNLTPLNPQFTEITVNGAGAPSAPLNRSIFEMELFVTLRMAIQDQNVLRTTTENRSFRFPVVVDTVTGLPLRCEQNPDIFLANFNACQTVGGYPLWPAQYMAHAQLNQPVCHLSRFGVNTRNPLAPGGPVPAPGVVALSVVGANSQMAVYRGNGFQNVCLEDGENCFPSSNQKGAYALRCPLRTELMNGSANASFANIDPGGIFNADWVRMQAQPANYKVVVNINQNNPLASGVTNKSNLYFGLGGNGGPNVWSIANLAFMSGQWMGQFMGQLFALIPAMIFGNKFNFKDWVPPANWYTCHGQTYLKRATGDDIAFCYTPTGCFSYQYWSMCGKKPFKFPCIKTSKQCNGKTLYFPCVQNLGRGVRYQDDNGGLVLPAWTVDP